jgi:hypothetical protein
MFCGACTARLDLVALALPPRGEHEYSACAACAPALRGAPHVLVYQTPYRRDGVLLLHTADALPPPPACACLASYVYCRECWRRGCEHGAHRWHHAEDRCYYWVRRMFAPVQR